MLYKEFDECRKKFYEAQKNYDEILAKKEVLFVKAISKGINYESERVTGGNPVNSFDEYLITKEKLQLDERLNEAKSILTDRNHLLVLKEQELRSSTAIPDKIYTYRYIDNMKIYKIARLVGYGEAQIYRILKSIRNNLR